MIRKLQRKFISITAAALFIMILLVLAAVNGIFFFQTSRQLDHRLDAIMNDRGFPWPGTPEDALPEDVRGNTLPRTPEDTFPGDARGNALSRTPPEIPASDKEVAFLLPPFRDRLRIHADGCVVCLDESGNILEIRQDAAENYSKEELAAVCSSLLAGERIRGWHQYFKFCIVRRAGTGRDGQTEILVGLINASSDLYAVFSMLLISAVIGIASFLLVLLIIILASKRAVKPIAESYTRQKQFVTDAGHELKTPLTVISANNELSRMIYGDSEWFDSIDKQVGKMNSLVRSLITLAKMDEEQALAPAPFSLSDAVYDTAKSFEGLLHSHGKLIAFDIAENIRYNGEESRLRQVVSILMDNAAKYCDEGGKVTVKLARDKAVRLQIVNDFSDIRHFDPTKVFERFYRADKSRTSDGSYGLGLSIARSIVEQHKGNIRAKTLEHDRVMFEVTLP